MRYQLAFLFLLATFLTSAQKVKVKNGKVLIDKKEVVNFEANGSIYTLSSLDNPSEAVLKVEYKVLDITPEDKKQWLKVSNGDTSKDTEIDFEFMSFTLNTKKAVAELLIKKYELIGPKGFDQAKIDEFFAEKRPDLTSRYESLADEVTKITQLNNAYTGELGIKVANDGVVTKQAKGDNTSSVIGKIVAPGQEAPGARIRVYDLDENLVAEAFYSGNNTYTVNPHSEFPQGGSSFQYSASHKFQPATKAVFFAELVEQLYIKGYPLENAIADYKYALKMAEYEQAIANSPNIYEKPGYVVTNEGKIEGKITCVFEVIYKPDGTVATEGVTDENAGKFVTIRYIQTNGKEINQKFEAEEEYRFCINNEDGTESCYQGWDVLKSGFSLADLGSSVKKILDRDMFFKEELIGDKLSLYRELPSGGWVFKNSNKEKAFKLESVTLKKGKERLKEYLDGCFFTEVFEVIDSSDEEKIKGFINLYNNVPCN
ncbi:hypothetical protein ACJD0Z_00560 [Flavobacteriaceae bacterium M23B6Z8]